MSNVTQLKLPGMSWMGELARGKNGVKPMLANAILIICNDADLAGLLGYDEFSHHVAVTRAPPVPFQGARLEVGPYPRAAQDADVSLIQSYIQRVYDTALSQQVMSQAVEVAARQRKYHPVRDWLTGLVWDGVPRLSTWLCIAFGAPRDSYHEAVGVKFMVASVARVRRPGCKFDAMLVLEGLQELGKSTACQMLYGQPWFSDEMPDMAGRDAPISMLGKWCVEIAELGSIIRAEIEVVKAFLSRQTDRYREMHARRFVDRPRQTMLIGTTNDTDYLRDSTGNRRFWPISCSRAEVAWLAENRDQLWAEAAHLESLGETTLWLDEEDVRATAKRAQAERLSEDVWLHAIREHVYHQSSGPLYEVRIGDLLHNALGLTRDKQNRSTEMRVAKILTAEGWKPRVAWKDGKSTRLWERGPP